MLVCVIICCFPGLICLHLHQVCHHVTYIWIFVIKSLKGLIRKKHLPQEGWPVEDSFHFSYVAQTDV